MRTFSKIFLTIFTFAIFATSLFAQELDTLWTRAFQNDNFRYIYDLKCDLNDNIITTGYIDLDGIFIQKFDENGDSVWTISQDCDHATSPDANIMITNENDYVISFYSGNNVELLKTDANGTVLWDGSYGGDYNDYPNDATLASDNGIAVTGAGNSGSGNSEVFLLKTDANGNEEFLQYYDNYENESEFAEAIVQTSDGGYLISGIRFNSEPWYYAGAFLQKTDADGNLEWIEDLNINIESEEFFVSNMDITSDDGIIIAGSKNITINGNIRRHACLIKVDQNGQVAWSQNYRHYNNAYGMDVKETSDNGFILLGETKTPDWGSPTKFYFVRTDSEGIVEWYGCIGSDEYNDKAMAVDIDSEVNIIAGGYVSSISYSANYLVKLNDELVDVEYTFDNLPEDFLIQSVYPNPFNPSTTISLALPSQVDLSVKVFNNNGQQVSVLADGQYSAGNHTFLFNASNLSSGTYFIQAIAPGIRSNVKRVMLIK